MFGATLRDHEARYEYAQEWLDIVKLAWSPREDFDFDGRFFKLKSVRAKPKPYGGTGPLIMNAGASATGQAFAIRNCDALFSTISRGISFEETAAHVSGVRALAQQAGREIDVYTVGVVTCRPTAREAQDYYRHAVVDNADWAAVDNILAMKNITPQTHSPEEFQRIRDHQANGMGGLPLVGNPDLVARDRRGWLSWGSGELRSRSSTISTSCRIFAPRCCHDWRARGFVRAGKRGGRVSSKPGR